MKQKNKIKIEKVEVSSQPSHSHTLISKHIIFSFYCREKKGTKF